MSGKFRYLIVSLFILLVIPVKLSGQMTINVQDPMTQAFLKQIIQTLVGNGVYVDPTSIKIYGSPTQIGIYSVNGNLGDLPFSKGLILSTGEAINIGRPDNPNQVMSGQIPPRGNDDMGDSLLNTLTTNKTKDAITLEFRFRPQTSPLVFRYGIGTEEYPGFVSDPQFNDVFGFFISGQNPAGGDFRDHNIAILPNSQVAGVYNIFSNPNYIIDTQGNDVHQFNGVSTAFSCSLNVVPCTDYLIKLKISDVSDESYDSAVFLQANSFGTVPVSLAAFPLIESEQLVAFEGCTPLKIVASKNDNSLLNQTITIPLTLSGTATNGTDYSGIPSELLIPAGQSSASIFVQAINDNIAEADETIIISYPMNCGLYDTIAIIIKDKPDITVTIDDPPSICSGSGPVTISASASGGLLPYTYAWSNGATNSSTQVNPSVTTTYTLTVTDLCGGTGTGSTTVNVSNNIPAPTANTNSPVCQGFDLNLSSSETAEAYTWSGPGGWIKTGASVTRSAMTPAEAGTYSLQIIKNGCPSAPLNFEVVVFDANYAPKATVNSPVCSGKILELKAGVTGAEKYFWSGPNGFTSSIENPQIPNVSSSHEGGYSVYFIAAGCTSAVATVQVQVKPTPLADGGPNLEICAMEQVTIGTAPVASVSYSWLPTTGLDNSNVSNPQLTPQNLSSVVLTTNYHLTADLNGCKAYDTITVRVKPVPVAGYPTPNDQCYKANSFDFNAQGNYPAEAKYQWDFGELANPATANTSIVKGVHFSNTGTYPVSLQIELNGCISNLYKNEIHVLEMPVANFSTETLSGCNPLIVNFKNLSGNTNQNLRYLWNFGNGFASSAFEPYSIYSKPGKFDVELVVTNKFGCTDEYKVPGMITVYPTPVARFSAQPFHTTITEPKVFFDDMSRYADTSLYIISRAGTKIDSVFAFDIEYTFKDSGTFLVSQYLTNEFGCSASYSRNVRVDLGFKLYIPSAFTPNDDDVNDYFRPYGEDISDFYIRIYNRWGQLIYQSWDIENGWDGKALLDGSVVPGGSYLYLIRLKDKYGKDYAFDGTVHVLR